MREILFRGKSTGTSKWVEGDFSQPNNILWVELGYDEVLNREEEVVYDEPVVPKTLGQYTGLCDKHCAKIFEGDFIKSNEGFVFEVVYAKAAFYAVCLKVKSRSYLHNIVLHSCEIIGNIHDNPELIDFDDVLIKLTL